MHICMQESVWARLCQIRAAHPALPPHRLFHSFSTLDTHPGFPVLKSSGLLPVLPTRGTSFRLLNSVWLMLGEKKHPRGQFGFQTGRGIPWMRLSPTCCCHRGPCSSPTLPAGHLTGTRQQQKACAQSCCTAKRRWRWGRGLGIPSRPVREGRSSRNPTLGCSTSAQGRGEHGLPAGRGSWHPIHRAVVERRRCMPGRAGSGGGMRLRSKGLRMLAANAIPLQACSSTKRRAVWLKVVPGALRFLQQILPSDT